MTYIYARCVMIQTPMTYIYATYVITQTPMTYIYANMCISALPHKNKKYSSVTIYKTHFWIFKKLSMLNKLENKTSIIKNPFSE